MDRRNREVRLKMAIIPETEFPGKIIAGNANYPYGQARDITTPSDGTGTPLRASLVNDIFGFLQATLIKGGVTPSGAPDTAVASQYLTALKNIIDAKIAAEPMLGRGQTWQNVSRSLGVTYTNNTGKPIQVSVCVYHDEQVVSTLSVSGVVVSRVRQEVGGATGYQDSTHTAIVPDGATYSVTGGSLISWAELS